MSDPIQATPPKPRRNLFNGAAIIPGNPGNSGGKKGRSGPKPEWYREYCRGMITAPATRKAVKAILANPNHPHFPGIYKTVVEQGFGKAAQPVVPQNPDGTALRFTMNLGPAAVLGAGGN